MFFGSPNDPRYWDAIFDIIPFPIYVTEIETRDVICVNRAMREKVAVNPGDKCFQAIRCQDKPCGYCKTPALLAGETNKAGAIVYDYFNDVDDRWYQVQESLITWFDGRRAKYSIAVDITSLKQVQNALAEAHAELALKNKELEAAARAKSDFLATMSHEIRTPMNGILGMAALLLDTRLHDDQRDKMETLKSSAEALLTILDDILDLSKLEAGRTEFEQVPFHLGRLFEGVTTLLQSRANAKGLQLTARIDPALPTWMVGDPGRLRQVLLNLVGNAVKFTDRGQVTLDARIRLAAGDKVGIHFDVTDTGIGIDKDSRARLFQSFSQADASISRRFGGTGLGLAICKRLVEGQGGQIGVESEPGQGSRFWFWLDFGRADGHACTAAPAVPQHALPPLRVLLAEDNVVNQKVALGLLGKGGHTVTVVGNGRDAVERVRSSEFDLVLMDMQMPEMDGLEAARAIRAMGGRAGAVPIVALTANAMPGDAERCLAAGMNAYVAKPINPRDLFDTMAGVLASGEGDDDEAEGGAVSVMTEFLGSDAMAELAAMFVTAGGKDYQELCRLMPSGALDDIALYAHDLKGMCGYVDAGALADLCAAIEGAAREGSDQECRALLATLPEVWEAAIRRVGRITDA